MKALSKTRQQVQTEESSRTSLETISKGTIAAMTGVSVIVGLWAVASFVGAMITSGGPLALATGWFQAVTGM
jgi:hypothetical protein